MEEVTGSIPVRSTNPFNNLSRANAQILQVQSLFPAAAVKVIFRACNLSTINSTALSNYFLMRLIAPVRSATAYFTSESDFNPFALAEAITSSASMRRPSIISGLPLAIPQENQRHAIQPGAKTRVFGSRNRNQAMNHARGNHGAGAICEAPIRWR
jgi:hypothetical protein